MKYPFDHNAWLRREDRLLKKGIYVFALYMAEDRLQGKQVKRVGMSLTDGQTCCCDCDMVHMVFALFGI